VTPAPYKISARGAGRGSRPGLGRRDVVRHIWEQTGNAEVLCWLCSAPVTTQLKISGWQRRGKMWHSANVRWTRSYRTGWWCP
jgi:hypothetical protein